MKILVVDNDTAIQDVMRDILIEGGHIVQCCSTALEACEQVGVHHFDFVFLDYKMPEYDGIWFMEHAPIPRGTKVLLMTAFVNRAVINRMFSLGISGYIIKPFDGDEIMRHLNYHAPAYPAAAVAR